MKIRINRYVAGATGASRRQADQFIVDGQVTINGQIAKLGDSVNDNDIISVNGKRVFYSNSEITIALNKPVGYVCSRNGQGSMTVYELLPQSYSTLKTIGRLDKDSSGLILLTSDGKLAHSLTHPSYQKTKVYEVKLAKPFSTSDKVRVEKGIKLADGVSRLALLPLNPDNNIWQITMHEGRNRQIRRTFEAIGNSVKELKRITFGDYSLGSLKSGQYRQV